MAEGDSNQVIEFLGKSFACEQASAVSTNSPESELVVKASPGLMMRWRGFDSSVLGDSESEFDLSQGDERGAPATLELDGWVYPILRATLVSRKVSGSVSIEMEGIAESVEYEGCDEVAKPVPFRAVFRLADTQT
jgi:hypothetical protein